MPAATGTAELTWPTLTCGRRWSGSTPHTGITDTHLAAVRDFLAQ
ncbi:hypothetical protein [Actinocrispum sp. NPDC049592]